MTINYTKQEEECLALNYAINILKAGFSEAPTIAWIQYVDWIPEVVRTLVKTQLDYRQVQIRIACISNDTGLKPEEIRKLMKEKTLSELEKFEKVGNTIVFHDFIKVSMDEEPELEIAKIGK